MNALTPRDLIPHDDYERIRESFRSRIIALKHRRRISVGDKVTLVFENRDTIQFQIQEMIRVEHIVDPVKIQDELDVYNALLPNAEELSATLLIEITEGGKIKEDLDAFQGIDRGETVALRLGSEVAYGRFEAGHSKDDKVSAVHFVRFPLSRGFGEALRKGEGAASIQVTHPNYRAEVQVPQAMVEEWRADVARRD
jgi:hypothetical protein